MRIFLITDIHYGEDTNYEKFGGLEYVNSFGSQFNSFLPSLLPKMKEADVVINLGDLIRDVDADNDEIHYKEARDLFKDIEGIKHVVGNHDIKYLGREKMAKLINEKKTYYSFDRAGYHHIVLDGNADVFKGPIYFSDEQLEWLKEDLAKTKLSTIVYSHFPLDNQNLEKNYYFANSPYPVFPKGSDAVRSLLEESNKVIAVFSGHLHFFSNQNISGIEYVTVPAFTENDGSHAPKAEYVLATVENNNFSFEVIKCEA